MQVQTKQFSLRLPDELYTALKQLAKARYTNVATLLRESAVGTVQNDKRSGFKTSD